MKTKILLSLGAAGCLFAGALSVTARDKDSDVPEHKLSEFKLGDHISGEEVKLSKMKGKVVAIEYWGTR